MMNKLSDPHWRPLEGAALWALRDLWLNGRLVKQGTEAGVLGREAQGERIYIRLRVYTLKPMTVLARRIHMMLDWTTDQKEINGGKEKN